VRLWRDLLNFSGINVATENNRRKTGSGRRLKSTPKTRMLAQMKEE